MLDQLFIAYPEGNGIDTFSFWESLYKGRYPVVLHNRVNKAFNDYLFWFWINGKILRKNI